MNDRHQRVEEMMIILLSGAIKQEKKFSRSHLHAYSHIYFVFIYIIFHFLHHHHHESFGGL